MKKKNSTNLPDLDLLRSYFGDDAKIIHVSLLFQDEVKKFLLSFEKAQKAAKESKIVFTSEKILMNRIRQATCFAGFFVFFFKKNNKNINFVLFFGLKNIKIVIY